MTTINDMLHRISATPWLFRRQLVNNARLHSEKECNGEYYFDDDKDAWIGYTGAPLFQHASDNSHAIGGETREREIRLAIKFMLGVDEIPPFIGYSGDPRGFVLKIFTEKLTPQEVETCRTLGFIADWGGDFTIIKSGEK